MRLSCEEICRIIGAEHALCCDRREVLGAAIDSRSIQPGQLFVCIAGSRVDGHNFAAQARAAGAGAILAERMPRDLPVDTPIMLVSDSVAALGRLAAWWRQASKATVIGITGTAGKTTVKEVLAHILGHSGPTAKNPVNLNNQIGLPLSILATEGKEKFWVLEVGISQTQDMDELGAILRPDLALVLNVGAGHTEGLGARKVAYYKARLLHYLSPYGLGLVSADYPDLVRESRVVCRNLHFFSIEGRQADYRAAYRGPGTGNKGWYRLWLKDESLDIEAPFRGHYGAENLIAAASVAHLAGMSATDIAQSLAGAQLPAQRFACRPAGPWLLVDDSYNANPLSCRRMLETAAEIAQGSPLLCVFGEMGELGEMAEEEHEALGRQIAAFSPAVLFWKGAYGAALNRGLASAAFAGKFIPVTNIEEFQACLERLSLPGGVALFKGSRLNHLEDFVKAFEKREANNAL